MRTTVTDAVRTAPLTQPHQTLQSSRDAGFDLPAAVGEVVDNAHQATASICRIRSVWAEDRSGVEAMAFADNGTGIDPDILANVLSLGYSSRYNSRTGIGRFGMGLKLASLSQARRVDVYTRPRGSKEVWHTFLDLDLVATGEQDELTSTPKPQFPEEYTDIVADPQSRVAFSTGTLVVWSKVDRLVQGGRYGTSVNERMQDLTKFLARAYREFIDKGFQIELDGRNISLHDPLFLKPNPRIIKRFRRDLKARIVEEYTFDIDGQPVHAIVTLLPKELRPEKGIGGRATKKTEEFKDLYIPDNEGKISILREGREIYYDLVPRLYPEGKQALDRFIGVQVSFPAILDEYFQVRNVKRGAEPVSKLREELREFVKRPIVAARKDIRRYWDEVERAEQAADTTNGGGSHSDAMDAVDAVEKTAPRGRAGLGISQEDANRELDKVLNAMGIDTTNPKTVETVTAVKDTVHRHPITLVDGSWFGKELFEITHLFGKAVVTLNHNHPFFAKVYDPIKAAAAKDPADLSHDDIAALLMSTRLALDVLFMAYAKAENLHDDPSQYDGLRSQWGIAAADYVGQVLAGR